MNLLFAAAARQDGACRACGPVAEMKAINSATTGFTTRAIEFISFGEIGHGSPGCEMIGDLREAVAFFEKNPPAQTQAPPQAFAH